MPKKDKKPSALKVPTRKELEPSPKKTQAKELMQLHRVGKPSNPFLVRHPPPRLGRRR